MSSFREIDGREAGPTAIGILAPPGKRTILIVRPRTLDWDLVLLRAAAGADFRELTLAEAAVGARAIFRALREWVAGGGGGVDASPQTEGGYHLRASLGSFPFLVCARMPGQPYAPLHCPTRIAAQEAVLALIDALRPAPGAEREVYLNSAFFSR